MGRNPNLGLLLACVDGERPVDAGIGLKRLARGALDPFRGEDAQRLRRFGRSLGLGSRCSVAREMRDPGSSDGEIMERQDKAMVPPWELLPISYCLHIGFSQFF